MLQDAGRRVGLVLASIVNFFNPSLIVVGGGVAQSGDQLLASIRETVYRRSLPLATRDLVIQRSSLGAMAGSSARRRWWSTSSSAASPWPAGARQTARLRSSTRRAPRRMRPPRPR